MRSSSLRPGRASASQRLLLPLLVCLTILAPLPGALADEAGSNVAIRNPSPRLILWEATFDERLGIFDYHVIATDPNGVEDLDHIEFRFRSEFDDRKGHVHEDHDVTLNGRDNGTWTGRTPFVVSGSAPIHRVELHIVDVNGVRFVTDRPYTTFDKVIDDATRELGEEPPVDPRERPTRSPSLPSIPFAPLARGVEIVSTPMGVIVWGLGMAVAVGLLTFTLARRKDEPAPRRPERARIVRVHDDRERE